MEGQGQYRARTQLPDSQSFSCQRRMPLEKSWTQERRGNSFVTKEQFASAWIRVVAARRMPQTKWQGSEHQQDSRTGHWAALSHLMGYLRNNASFKWTRQTSFAKTILRVSDAVTSANVPGRLASGSVSHRQARRPVGAALRSAPLLVQRWARALRHRAGAARHRVPRRRARH